jgi:hypothetical protein
MFDDARYAHLGRRWTCGTRDFGIEHQEPGLHRARNAAADAVADLGG